MKARLSGKPLSLVPGKVVFGVSYHGSRQESASRGGPLGSFLVRGGQNEVAPRVIPPETVTPEPEAFGVPLVPSTG